MEVHYDESTEVDWLDVAWDAYTNPHMSYWFLPEGDPPELYYSYWDTDAEQWENEFTDITADCGSGSTAIALDSQGNPCIIYVDRCGTGGFHLNFTCRGSNWSTPELIDNVQINLDVVPSLVFKDDVPCVSYPKHHLSDINLVVKCRDNTAGWDVEPEFEYENPFNGGPQGTYSDLQVGSGLMVAFSGDHLACGQIGGTTVFAAEDNAWEAEPVFPLGETCEDAGELIDLRIGSQPHVVVQKSVTELFHSARNIDGDWHWEQVNSDVNPWGRYELYTYAGLGLRGAAPHIVARIQNQSLNHLYMLDADGDGTADEEDPFIASGIISGYEVEIEGYPNVFALIEGEHEVQIGPVSFDWDFDEEQLDLSGMMINTGEDYIEVHGIYDEIPNGKTVRIPEGSYGYACILDVPGATAVRMTNTCNGENEIKVSCPGSSGDYECEITGNHYKISGLHHSAVKLGGTLGGPALSPCEDIGGIICGEGQACSTGDFVEALDSNSCCLETCVSAADLTVTDVSVDDPILFKDTVASISVTVKNIGPFESESFSVSLAVKDGANIGEQTIDALAFLLLTLILQLMMVC
jgi:hypothetical protein